MTPKHTIILAVAIACMCLSAPTRVVGQTEKFDIVHYTPPAKWKKTSQESKVVYSTVDESKSSFCIITIYASTNSFGSPEKDFKNHWDALVVQLTFHSPAVGYAQKQCYFNESQSSRLAELNGGQEAIVEGSVRGIGGGLGGKGFVVLENCTVP